MRLARSIECFVLSLALWSMMADSAIAQTCKSAERNTEFGRWFSPGVSITAQNTLALVESGYENVASVRVHLAWKSGTSRRWRLVLRDLDERILASVGPDDFEGQSASVQSRKTWTGRLPAKSIRAHLQLEPTVDAEVEVVSGIAYPSAADGALLFSTQSHAPQWKPLFLDGVIRRRAGDATGMLVSAAVLPDGQKRSWCCSGTMIADGIFMTNWHCGGFSQMPSASFWNEDVCGNTLIDLGWEDGSKLRVQLSCVEVIAKSEELDVVFIRVRSTVGAGSVGQPPYARISQEFTTGDTFLIHHAMCRPKLVSSCQILEETPGLTSIRHQCDTELGSSGAAMFDSAGRVVGVHHSGFARDKDCAIIDSDNRATKISSVIQFLKTAVPEVAAELLDKTN
jgi:V8-like Glu-specific endopeptidase